MTRWMKALLAVLVILPAVACGSTNATQPAGGSANSSSPRTPAPGIISRAAAVYSAVLERYLGTELSVGGPADVGTVYILTHAGKDQGSADEPPAALPLRVQRAVSNTLAEHYRVRWIDDQDEVGLTGRLDCDPSGKRDVVIALGKVPPGKDRVQVSLDGYSDCGLAGGWIYRLTHDGDSWTVSKHRASWQT